jgi:hypothetical protein
VYIRRKSSCRGVHNVDEIGRECYRWERDEKCVESFDGKTKGSRPLGRNK